MSCRVITGVVLAGAIATGVVLSQTESSPAGPLPFAATEAAATGREVPAQVGSTFQNYHRPRVAGSDSKGQEYALSSGSEGVCLVAVRGAAATGFEACAPTDKSRDLTVTTYVGNGRIRTVLLQAAASDSAPAAARGGERVAPGLWVTETAGELPGG